MKPFEVHVYETRRSYAPVMIPDVFTFNPKARLHWLQRACLWTLRKLGCHHWGEEEKIARVLIDPRRVMEALFRQHSEVADALNEEPSRLFIGAEDFKELMMDKDALPYMTFRTEYNYGRRILGLNITVVPWMRGLLVTGE
ncbi:MAG: hypothetical protein A3E01_04645 [Gammaproteobacteria bacterium RIFCSPHIGHO2_12_FULL_63_22]|nr:MAG: hypothetical protein A3E01_04645 [Gammaproteobacteria bacterium RIFCSPHIGHO2_12_FULL_63_22]